MLTPQHGKKYKIRHRGDLQRYDRVSVMVYLGHGATDDEWQFSARPVAGTQTLLKRQIKEIQRVDQTSPVYLNRRAYKA